MTLMASTCCIDRLDVYYGTEVGIILMESGTEMINDCSLNYHDDDDDGDDSMKLERYLF